MTAVKRELVGELTNVLESMLAHLKTRDQKGKQYGKILETAKKTVERIKAVQVEDNPLLDKLADQIAKLAEKKTPDALRLSGRARGEVVREADSLMAALNAAFGG